MRITFDPAKSEKNLRERGLPFTRAEGFDFANAHYKQDNRKIYPEKRIVALGYLGARLHSLCFTPTTEGIRVISFRKANQREVRNYEKEKIYTAHPQKW